MTQPRSHSAIEAAANILAGMMFQYLIGMGVLHALGYRISAGENVLVTAVMTVASFTRQYIIRRAFEGGRRAA